VIVEVQRRSHVQRLTYEDFEQRIRDGELSARTRVRFEAVTGDQFRELGELELYQELMAPDRAAFRAGLLKTGVPLVTALLVGGQVRVYLLSQDPGRRRWMQDNLTNDATAVIEQGEVWRLLSYGLLHFGFTHALFNLFFLAYAGYNLERALGPRNLALIYFFSVLTGGALSVGMTPGVSSLGASGGVFGLIAATVVLGWKRWDDIPAASRRFFGWALLPYLVVTGISGMTSATTDNWSHLGGMLGGVFLMTVLEPQALAARQGANRLWQGVAVAGAAALLLGLRLGGTGLVALIPDDDEAGFTVDRPAVWNPGWLFTGDRGWASKTFQAELGLATTTHPRPITAPAAADALLDRVTAGSRGARVVSREPVVRDGVHGERLRLAFDFAEQAQEAEALVLVRGVYEHRVVLKTTADARGRYLPMAGRVFESLRLEPLPEVEEARARARQHPRSWEPAVAYGDALYRTGSPGEALASYERALGLSPGEPAALLGLLRTIQHYELPGGPAAAARALELAGDHPKVVVAAVELLEASGDPAAAVAALDQAWALLPGDRALRRARNQRGLPVELPPPG